MDRLAKLAADTAWRRFEELAVRYWLQYPEEIDPYGWMTLYLREASIRETTQGVRIGVPGAVDRGRTPRPRKGSELRDSVINP